MAQTLVWLILTILPCIPGIRSASTTTSIQKQTSTISSTPAQSSRNNEDIEYRLIRLEVLLGEKLETTNRRLQALEWQSAEIRSSLKALRTGLTKIFQKAPSGSATLVQQSNTMLEETVENLHKDVKTLKTFLTTDVNDLKKNVSSLLNDTRSMLRSTFHFVSKQFLNQSILHLKHQPAASSNSSKPSTALPKNCKEIKESGQWFSGMYSIQPEHSVKPISVFCDLYTLGGGWTVIQNRFDGSEDFYRNWQEYKLGFGNPNGEFWAGLDTIHLLTGYQANELLIELQDFDLQNKTAYYASFSVGPEVDGFPLKILNGYGGGLAGGGGDAGDSMPFNIGRKFTTKDVDNDVWNGGNCAHERGGGWWHHDCGVTNLNGRYLGKGIVSYNGVHWYTFNSQVGLKRTRMLVRQQGCGGFKQQQ